ncbi:MULTISPECIES: LysR family transcriptional regulator [unclassified Streptomyces]|uniref:LysR family transcriptional regulator n=1 Tax=unclassified Streptomyces TaxID=2593676 RepID=UPI000DB98A40|nr:MULTISPECIES: LysR family transcriptional regulator [unclassified Streptomyces]MYT68212.1 LysR family transcriptional regulator [Streptomyces sp. SID8367]RAJ76841.1 DNA-binding transcriptional LysR family regulator [Streptomyces sp. PsTaAH-137]
MELRQLRYFVCVVEEGGFTRAAARLHLAQPGLSAQIRQLEKELGQPLLDRSGRSVTPTEVGRAVLPYARTALAAAESVAQTVDAYTGLLRGRVTIKMVSGATGHAFDIAALLADFHDSHPSVEVALTEDTTERMQAALLAGELDIAVLGTAQDVPPPGVDFQMVIDVPLVAAVAPGDPLLNRVRGPSIELAELRDHKLICLPRGSGVRAALEQGCAQAGFRPRVAFDAAAPHVLSQLAARGLGIAVLPASEDGSPVDAQLRTLQIVRPEMRARIALAWQTGGPSGPAAQALLARLREAFPKPLKHQGPAGTTASDINCPRD